MGSSLAASSDVVYEFYHPFAHIPGRYEWCTIHSPTHGSFDCFIVIHHGTDAPVTVYVNGERGERFMRDRYPESECIRVPEADLVVESRARGREVHARLRTARGSRSSPGVAHPGPLLEAEVLLSADADAVPEQVSYGGESFRVWGSRLFCEGVDLNLSGVASGYIVRSGLSREDLGPGSRGIVAVGSYGRIGRLVSRAR